MYLPKPSGGDFKPAPSGTHKALCIGVLDLGTQDDNFGNRKRQVMIRWQLCDEYMDDGRPFMLSKKYTFSTHEKANFRRDLESWRGKKFEEADFGPGGFEMKKLLNVGCLLNVVHSTGETTYANVAGVSGIPKGMEKAAPVADPEYLSLEKGEFSETVFEKLSDKLKDIIRKSPEYQAIYAPKPKPALRAVGNGAPQQDTYSADMDDEIPF